MAFYTDGVVPWNSLDDNTRAPLASELEAGYPCGELDRELFNWTAGWPTGNIWNMILQSGITPNTAKLLDLARAVQAGKVNYAATSGGSANALTASLSPAITSYTDGLIVRIKPAAANTNTAPTLALNGLAAKTIEHQDGGALVAGEIAANVPFMVAYNAANDRWILIGGVTRKQLVDRVPYLMRQAVVTLPNTGLTVSTLNVTFPTAFPNSCIGVLITTNTPVATDGWIGIAWASNITASGCQLAVDTNGTKIINQTITATYIALGT